MTYKHGVYGELTESQVAAAVQSGTVAAYVGTAPVHLLKDYSGLVNTPIELTGYSQAMQTIGYSDDWTNYTLCEAVAEHFNNSVQSAGPIYVVNVLDPDALKSSEQTTVTITTVNGKYSFKSDNIILNTFAISSKTEGKDFEVSYSFAKGEVTVTALSGELSAVTASYYTVDPSKVTAADVIGETIESGELKGLDALKLLYQKYNVVLNLLGAPKFSEDPSVYKAMCSHVQHLNGHWDAMVVADIPLSDSDGAIDTRAKAIAWKEKHGYTSEFSKVCWPKYKDGAGKVHGISSAVIATQLAVDEENDNVPYESASNNECEAVELYYGEDAKNAGLMGDEEANELNAKGITTVCFLGGVYKIWGPHTAAYIYGGSFDARDTFDTYIRTLMYIINDFQVRFAGRIDQAMSPNDKDSILKEEQDFLDGLKAMGALVGSSTVSFESTDNPTSSLIDGNFVFTIGVTTAPLAKSISTKAYYTDSGLSEYFVQA